MHITNSTHSTVQKKMFITIKELPTDYVIVTCPEGYTIYTAGNHIHLTPVNKTDE